MVFLVIKQFIQHVRIEKFRPQDRENHDEHHKTYDRNHQASDGNTFGALEHADKREQEAEEP